MNKFAKSRLIKAIICLVIGFILLLYVYLGDNINTELKSYLNGLSFGIGLIGVYFLIHSLFLLRSPKKSKEMENIQKDERLILIYDKSMALSFKVIILIEAVVSIISAFMGNMVIAEIIGILLAIQMIIYLIMYFIVWKIN